MPKEKIINVTYFPPQNDSLPAFGILWSSGVTHFYPWDNYPYTPDFSKIKPWVKTTQPIKLRDFGDLLFYKAPSYMNNLDIFRHNIKNYMPSNKIPHIDKTGNVVPRLEAIYEEIEAVNKQRVLYKN